MDTVFRLGIVKNALSLINPNVFYNTSNILQILYILNNQKIPPYICTFMVTHVEGLSVRQRHTIQQLAFRSFSSLSKGGGCKINNIKLLFKLYGNKINRLLLKTYELYLCRKQYHVCNTCFHKTIEMTELIFKNALSIIDSRYITSLLDKIISNHEQPTKYTHDIIEYLLSFMQENNMTVNPTHSNVLFEYLCTNNVYEDIGMLEKYYPTYLDNVEKNDTIIEKILYLYINSYKSCIHRFRNVIDKYPNQVKRILPKPTTRYIGVYTECEMLHLCISRNKIDFTAILLKFCNNNELSLHNTFCHSISHGNIQIIIMFSDDMFKEVNKLSLQRAMVESANMKTNLYLIDKFAQFKLLDKRFLNILLFRVRHDTYHHYRSEQYLVYELMYIKKLKDYGGCIYNLVPWMYDIWCDNSFIFHHPVYQTWIKNPSAHNFRDLFKDRMKELLDKRERNNIIQLCIDTLHNLSYEVYDGLYPTYDRHL